MLSRVKGWVFRRRLVYWVPLPLALISQGCGVEELPPPWMAPPSEAVVGANIAGSESYEDELSAPALPALDAASFEGPARCGACHSEHFEQWRRSPHAKAMHDPVFRGLIALQQEELPVGSERFCVQCHSPVGLRSGSIEAPVAFEGLDEIALAGVSCEVCHRTSHVERTLNAGLAISSDAVLRGPLADPTAPHAVRYDPLFESSTLCAACHDVQSVAGLWLETPYREWLNSPAAVEGKTCQTCHMPSYRGQAAPAFNSPDRESLHQHGFRAIEAGADDSSISACAGPGELCAAAEIEAELRYDAAGDVELRVRVESRTMGHDFPTGSTFFRQVWLAVEITDSRGQRVFQSGQFDDRQDLYDLHSPEAETRDPQLQVFSGYLRDESGQLTQFPWRASQLETNGLKPLEVREVNYRVARASADALPLRAHVRLRFRTFPPRLLRSIGRDDLVATLHPIDVRSVTVEMQTMPSASAEPEL